MIDGEAGYSSTSRPARTRRSSRRAGDCEFRQSLHNGNPMKIDTSFKIFKFSRLVPLGIAIAAILVTQPIRAGVVPMSEIVLTEHSPTSLTATLNGSASGITVLNTGQDQWTVTFPTTISFNNGLNNLPAGWGEPEATESNLIYNVISSPSLNNQLFVYEVRLSGFWF